MPALYKSTCYPTALQARQTYLSDGVQTVVSSAAEVVSLSFSDTNTSDNLYSVTRCVTPNKNNPQTICDTQTQTYPAFADCAYSETHTDMMALSALVVLVLVTILCAKRIYTVFMKPYEAA